jgi:hypothetical protein
MSRSRKRWSCIWLTRRWDRFRERAYRKRMKQVMHDVEIDWDPDKDWEEANMSHKKAAMAEYGTKCEFEVGLDPDDSLYDEYVKLLRK